MTVKSGATLGGTGTVLGPVTVEPNGTLAPGASLGTLTVSNTVTLQGSTVMEVSRDGGTATSDLLTGVTTLNYGGTLLVNGSLASGSAVTVASGARLGGSGTINGATTVNGSVAPGGGPDDEKQDHDPIKPPGSGPTGELEVGHH